MDDKPKIIRKLIHLSKSGWAVEKNCALRLQSSTHCGKIVHQKAIFAGDVLIQSANGEEGWDFSSRLP